MPCRIVPALALIAAVALLLLVGTAAAVPVSPPRDVPPHFIVHRLGEQLLATWIEPAEVAPVPAEQWLLAEGVEIWRDTLAGASYTVPLPASWEPGDELTLCRQWPPAAASCHTLRPGLAQLLHLPALAQ